MAPVVLPPLSGLPSSLKTRFCNSSAASPHSASRFSNKVFRLGLWQCSAHAAKPYSPSRQVSMRSFSESTVRSLWRGQEGAGSLNRSQASSAVGLTDSATDLPAKPPVTAPARPPTAIVMGPPMAPAAIPASAPPAVPMPVPRGWAPGWSVIGSRFICFSSNIEWLLEGLDQSVPESSLDQPWRFALRCCKPAERPGDLHA